MKHLHTIPVDASQTPEEAWREQCIFGRRVTFTGSETWANITCDGEECHAVEWDESGWGEGVGARRG